MEDERDAKREQNSVEDLAEKLRVQREQIKELDGQARKVPALERELERVNSELEKQREAGKRQSDENGDLERKVREIRSELGNQIDLQEECKRAKAAIQAAEDALTDKDEQIAEATRELSDYQGKVDELVAEVDRLKPHEEQTKTFLEAVKKAEAIS